MHLIQERNVTLNLSERISRLVLVCSGIGFLGYIFKVLYQSINKSFSTVYLGSIPLGVDQVFSIILLINTFIILYVGIVYCYFELHNYGNYKNPERNVYIHKADKYYRLLLNISYMSSFMGLILIAFLFSILPLFIAFKSTAFSFLGIIMLIILGATIKKWRGHWFNNFLRWLKGLNKYYIYGIIIGIWALFFPIFVNVGINQNLNTHFEITFNNDNVPQVYFLYKDHTLDKMPDEIYINIVTPSKHEKLTLKKNDFNFSLIIVNGSQQNNSPMANYIEKINKFSVSKSYFSLDKSINLKQLDGKVEGYIEINFRDKNGLSEKNTYRIFNSFSIQKGKISFNQKKFDIKL